MSFGIIDSTGYAAYHTLQERTIFTSYSDKDSTEKALRQSRGLVETIYQEYREL
jgi:hypothetical protein